MFYLNTNVLSMLVDMEENYWQEMLVMSMDEKSMLEKFFDDFHI